MLIDEYIAYSNKYTEKFGKNTIVLMQVGSFYEMYGIDSETKPSEIREISSKLGILVTRKNKKIMENSRENPLLSGFPMIMLEKYVEVLVDFQYNVVIVEQISPPPDVKRQVTRICGPGTFEGHFIANETTNNIFHVYLEMYDKTKSIFVAGVSSVDCSTGEVYADQISMKDELAFIQKMQNFRIRFKPKRTMLSVKSKETIDNILDVCQTLKVNRESVDVFQSTSKNKFLNIAFMRAVLNQFYINKTQLDIVEFLDLERMIYALISISYLCEFINEHGLKLEYTLNRPKLIDADDSLHVSYNAYEQLNITSGEMSILKLLNNCITSIGKRYFEYRLLNPTSDVFKLNDSFRHINKMERLSNSERQTIYDEMKKVKDVQKLFRKPCASPRDFIALHESFTAIQKLAVLGVHESKDMAAIDSAFRMNSMIEEWFCFESTDNCFDDDITIESRPFFRSLCNDAINIDDLISTYKETQTTYRNFVNNLPGDDHFKLEQNEKDGYHIICTVKRFLDWSKKSNDVKQCKIIHKGTSSCKLQIPNGHVLNDDMRNAKCIVEEELKNCLTVYWKKFKDEISYEEMKGIVSIIEFFDFYSTCVTNNNRFHLSRPEIVVDTNKAMIRASDLRHLIIENHNQELKYIPNDIFLDAKGLVLFGVNASGKSSFMKSVGIAIILAQSGMYVPASSFQFNPFKKVFTRITGNDNIFRKQSTFVLEMSELRTILNDADRNSLVIGDEICSGTETVSAVSIVTASIYSLCKSEAIFIFATHLHELPELISETSTLIKHFTVKYSNGNMIYDRKLEDGPGDSLYGLEVCKSLDMKAEFIESAFKIRKRLLKENSTTKSSRYNSKLYYNGGKCALCDGNFQSVDIHHIKEQNTSDQFGNIDHYHKNDMHNLIPVCKSCHQKVHSGELSINGYVHSSIGRIVV